MTPVSHCSVCDVDKAFSDGASDTIFEVEGRFDGNLESRVKLVGVKLFFMKYAVDRIHERRQSISRGRGVVGPLVPSY